MHVLVKLLGTLSACYRGNYSAAAGLELEVPVGLTVTGLVERIGIEKERVGIVTINGFLAKADDCIPEDAIVKLIQPISGG